MLPFFVAQQVLPVFLRHADGAKPATERVLKVIHADRRKPVGAARLKRCSDSGPVPRRRGRRSIHLLGCELVETTGVFGLDEKVQPRASHSSP